MHVHGHIEIAVEQGHPGPVPEDADLHGLAPLLVALHQASRQGEAHRLPLRQCPGLASVPELAHDAVLDFHRDVPIVADIQHRAAQAEGVQIIGRLPVAQAHHPLPLREYRHIRFPLPGDGGKAGEQADAEGRQQHGRQHAAAAGGLFPCHNGHHSFFDGMLAVAGIGGRTGRPGRGGYQGGGVLRPAVPARPGQHRLVAVQLHVPGQENRQHPGQGVVPVQADHQQGEAPFQVVPPGQVDGLVEEHQGKGLLRHAGGQENGGAEQAAGHGGGQSGVLQHPEPTA